MDNKIKQKAATNVKRNTNFSKPLLVKEVVFPPPDRPKPVPLA